MRFGMVGGALYIDWSVVAVAVSGEMDGADIGRMILEVWLRGFHSRRAGFANVTVLRVAALAGHVEQLV